MTSALHGEASAPSGFSFRGHTSPVALALLVVTLVAVVIGVVMAAGDGDGDTLWGLMMLGAPSVVVFYSVVEVIWRRSSNWLHDVVYSTIILPALVALLCTAVAWVTLQVRPVARLLEANTRANGFHYWFDTENASAMVFVFLGQWVLAMLSGLAAFLLVLWPAQLIHRPTDMMAATLLDTSPKHARANTAAGWAIYVVLLVTFAAPTAFVLGNVPLGSLLTAIGVAALATVIVVRRVDRKRFMESGAHIVIDIHGDLHQ